MKAILLKKIEGRRESEILIQDEVLDFLATRFSSDVRKLEGSLNELFFKAVLYLSLIHIYHVFVFSSVTNFILSKGLQEYGRCV